jgi:hypothetical protein
MQTDGNAVRAHSQAGSDDSRHHRHLILTPGRPNCCHTNLGKKSLAIEIPMEHEPLDVVPTRRSMVICHQCCVLLTRYGSCLWFRTSTFVALPRRVGIRIGTYQTTL